MNIVLITIAYPPEIRSISTMTQELVEELVVRGHKVTVLTSWPRYNLSQEDKQRKFEADTTENGVRVIRIKTLPHHKVNYLLRGVAQVTLPFFFRRAFKKFVKDKVDAVIVYSPHLPLVQVGVKIKKIHRARYLLNIQDIFPQNAIDLGILKNKTAIRFFEKMELQAYQDADAITTCTDGARKFLIEKKGVPENKITVAHNWVDPSLYERVRAGGEFRQRYNLENKFIFLFPGVFGPSQGLEFLIQIVQRIVDLKDVVFLFVGDGTEKQRIQDMVKKYGLNNVQFEPFVSLEQYPSLLKEADVGILCLGKDSKTPTIPGKFFGFAAASLPVLAFLNPESEGHEIIKKAQCGFSMISSDPQKGAELVRGMYRERDQLELYGKNGYNYVVANFSKMACIDKLEQLIMA